MENKRDINVLIDDAILNTRSVAVVIDKEGRVLVQKRENDKYWALPGGKVEIMEKSEDTIVRELKEELGIENICVEKLVAVSEHFFEFNSKKCHQYIFTYKVNIDTLEWIYEKNEFSGIEKDKDLRYKWISIKDVENIQVKPDFLAKQLLNIEKNEIQFISYVEQ